MRRCVAFSVALALLPAPCFAQSAADEFRRWNDQRIEQQRRETELQTREWWAERQRLDERLDRALRDMDADQRQRDLESRIERIERETGLWPSRP